MLTARCNLSCRYCFREATQSIIDKELSFEDVKLAIKKLYDDFNIRKITISGGEPTFWKDNISENFIGLIDYLKQFKSEKEEDNLKIVLITNGTLLTPTIMKQLVGVVDKITITIDAVNARTLTKLGRNTGCGDYFEKSIERINKLADLGMEIKLHSVVSKINYDDILDLAYFLRDNLNVKIQKWKLFQYMGFGNLKIDEEFNISKEKFVNLQKQLEDIFKNKDINFSFKSVDDQEVSLFNLLPDGRFEYAITEDGLCKRGYSKPIFNYSSWTSLLNDCPNNSTIFNHLNI